VRARLLLPALLLASLTACRDASAPLPGSDQPLAVLAGAPLLDGTRLDPASLDGKVVVVNFWSPG
jgi:hypothetical protein